MGRIARRFEALERWRLGRCREGSPAGSLTLGALVLPGSLGVLAQGLRGLPEESVGTVLAGCLLFAAGCTSLGRAFWERQVLALRRRLEVGPERRD